jgi:hypothetical protein
MAAVPISVRDAYGDPSSWGIGERYAAVIPRMEMPAAFTPSTPRQYAAISSLAMIPGNVKPGFGAFIPDPVGRVLPPRMSAKPSPRPLMFNQTVNPYYNDQEIYSGNVPFLDHE